MYGVLRLADQRENAIKSALTEGYFESGARSKSVGAYPSNIGEEKIFERRVVGDVQKNGAVPSAKLCGASNLFCGLSCCHCGSRSCWSESRIPQFWHLCESCGVPRERVHPCGSSKRLKSAPCLEPSPAGCCRL